VRLLLDTHAFAWAALKPDRLPAVARAAIANSDTEVVVSAASIWEISIKHHAGRWPEASALLTNTEDTLRKLRFVPLSISLSHARAAGSLAGPHRDPFDRLLIAQGRVEDLVIVTADRVFAAYNVKTLWAD
jgi:PIN domain nuclease of toxin-antitoxin system